MICSYKGNKYYIILNEFWTKAIKFVSLYLYHSTEKQIKLYVYDKNGVYSKDVWKGMGFVKIDLTHWCIRKYEVVYYNHIYNQYASWRSVLCVVYIHQHVFCICIHIYFILPLSFLPLLHQCSFTFCMCIYIKSLLIGYSFYSFLYLPIKLVLCFGVFCLVCKRVNVFVYAYVCALYLRTWLAVRVCSV